MERLGLLRYCWMDCHYLAMVLQTLLSWVTKGLFHFTGLGKIGAKMQLAIIICTLSIPQEGNMGSRLLLARSPGCFLVMPSHSFTVKQLEANILALPHARFSIHQKWGHKDRALL